MAVWIDIDPRGGVPIYVQLASQVRHAIEVGGLASGEKLPTVRGLAEELEIAPNTIVKAYNELQREGLVESRAGVGTVVAEGVAEIAEGRQREAVFERLRVLVRDAVALGITEDDLWESFDSEFERIPRESGGAGVMADVRVERAPALQEKNAAIRIEGFGVNHGRSRL